MRALLVFWLGLAAACTKVPLVEVRAGFDLADATWFEAEQTLFVFYRVSADQGIGPESAVEVTYTTDDGVMPWTEVSQLTPVHLHVPAVCSPGALCGSTSLAVTKVPRNVGVRLRWARGGAMTLDAQVTFNVVGAGPPYTNRSLVVYGVLDETNVRPQWRARHVFPTLRNQQVTDLGLRRAFALTDERFGSLDAGSVSSKNPYGYGFTTACPSDFVRTREAGPVGTTDRAVFDDTDLPIAASTAEDVCALATVRDATGTFSAPALARKNPETRPAFPSLRSPIQTDTQVKFLLEPCQRVISAPHLAMQEQRLGWTHADSTVCIDDWQQPGFADLLAGDFAKRLDTVRAQGNDMILSIALNHDDRTGQLAAIVENALNQILPAEQNKSSPRAVGAFVFDSYPHLIATDALKQVVLWCPAVIFDFDGGTIPDTAARSCPVLPDNPTLNLGPFTFGTLPILPPRDQYLTFIGQFSTAQAGQMTSLAFRAPELTPISQNISIPPFAVVTFFNDETISAAPSDAFSYCQTGSRVIAVFRSAQISIPLPLQLLPQAQSVAPQGIYDLGLAWDFPFLMRLNYSANVAGSATAFSVTVPFGVGTSTTSYYGADLWSQSDFPLSDVLAQCTRFCDDPTFDSAGVYEVAQPFRQTYANQCYRPIFPRLTDTGFPLDP